MKKSAIWLMAFALYSIQAFSVGLGHLQQAGLETVFNNLR